MFPEIINKGKRNKEEKVLFGFLLRTRDKGFNREKEILLNRFESNLKRYVESTTACNEYIDRIFVPTREMRRKFRHIEICIIDMFCKHGNQINQSNGNEYVKHIWEKVREHNDKAWGTTSNKKAKASRP